MAPEAPTAVDGDAAGPRRSGLLQERSRQTRRRLVRTALRLWSEKGFERGIEETSVEEIAREAGVTKGTFYFHFEHKEDILLEMGWAAAEELMKEAELGMLRGRPAAEILQSLMAFLVRRVEHTPRAAFVRSVAEFSRRAHHRPPRAGGAVGFASAFSAVAAYGIDRGELPPATDADDFGATVQAVTMDTLVRWAMGRRGSLRTALSLHADIVVAGTAAVYADRAPRRSRSRPS